ncbi:hypothetical protein BCR41DRAFT_401082 [Lobosporangium transversale]|uniref:Uncharacterized protein n=1 Tax=Lobosporangium transversale TaxID=64571 RepID=A0A1Y2GA48_9FUNG|nr:hypothetical protein BCR41DRAFT_401082 [Lobosporangium transversale]ORZ04409.1 hypothetical protein BCR41DRAFT_401082 [Lobosporangium transversale]|eukprot:XP_021876517.1 hypothetical protein BCR41DRAFT_401082 [Lobosporangium transversale]
MAHSEHNQVHISRKCQHISTLRSGPKRSLHRPSEQKLHQQARRQQRQTSQELEPLHTTGPRVTTVVTMTPTSPISASNGKQIVGTTIVQQDVKGSTSEQDKIEVREKQSSGSKRARVQQAEHRESSTPREASKGHGSRRNSGSNNRRPSQGNTPYILRSQTQQIEYIEITDEETDLEQKSGDASDEDRDNWRDTQDGSTKSPGSNSAVTSSTTGVRRVSQTLPLYHHCNHHHRHHHQRICDEGSSSILLNTRDVHQTHTRNYSSPSLLDSFTSPDPMLSPIQSYFGSDPNSPASSFSLPRHDHYPRLTIDPSASMDGYHGFATHPWSEQSTTPSRALSHRWTRRLSQSDLHPDSSSNTTNSRGANSRANPRQRHSSIGIPRSFTAATADQLWDTTSSNMETSIAPDESIDTEHDLVPLDDAPQDSEYESNVDENYEGYESTHDHQFDHDYISRDSDNEEDMDQDVSYSYDLQDSSVDMNDDRTEETEDDTESGPNEDVEGSDDDDEEESDQDMADSSNFIYTTPSAFSHSSQPSTRHRDSRSSRNAGGREHVQSNESDEALARRLQEEEYTAMLGESSLIGHLTMALSRNRSLRTRRRHSSAYRTNVARNRTDNGTFLSQSDQYVHPWMMDNMRSRIRGADTRTSARLLGLRSTFIGHHVLRQSRNEHYLSSMNNMWGSPADYLYDDQVDDSYEGLLRLSERIGDAKPKGVPSHVLKMTDKYIITWKPKKVKNMTLSMSAGCTLSDSKDTSGVSAPSPSPAYRSRFSSRYSLRRNDASLSNSNIPLPPSLLPNTSLQSKTCLTAYNPTPDESSDERQEVTVASVEAMVG